jgi:hypothetical protein
MPFQNGTKTPGENLMTKAQDLRALIAHPDKYASRVETSGRHGVVLNFESAWLNKAYDEVYSLVDLYHAMESEA